MPVSLEKTIRRDITLNSEYIPNALLRECPERYSDWWEYHTKSGRAYLFVTLPNGDIVQHGRGLYRIIPRARPRPSICGERI